MNPSLNRLTRHHRLRPGAIALLLAALLPTPAPVSPSLSPTSAGAGEATTLPDAIGAVTLGRDPEAGCWVEYRLRLPVDPLDARLTRESLDPPDRPTIPEPVAATLAPPFELPPEWTEIPVRLTVMDVTPLTLTLEISSIGIDPPTRITVPRTTPLSDAIVLSLEKEIRPPSETGMVAATDPAPDLLESAAPAETGSAEMALYRQTLTVRTELFGEGDDAVEIWTHPEPTFGICRLRTREMDLMLRGFGRDDAPPFPLTSASASVSASASANPQRSVTIR